MSESAPKKARSSPEYELLYWPGTPGRGEVIRLALEESGASYIDTPASPSSVVALISPDYKDPNNNPPPLAPPILKCGHLLLSQTTNILLFLGPRLGLAPGGEEPCRFHVNELTLTACDLGDEAHNTHHPVGVGEYYEDQKPEALRAAKQFREKRIPKFLGYFERVLAANAEKNEGGYLVGKELTYADLAVWQLVDGLKFAFPKAAGRELEKLVLLKAHYDAVKVRPKIKAYLESDHRKPYSMGIFRHYPELDE